VITTIVVGKLLDPWSASRLVMLTAGVAVVALGVTVLVVRGIESRDVEGVPAASATHARPPFREALAEVWREPQARRFTIFVFVSMLAYSGQELILEPFAGSVFAMTPGQSTQLSGLQHGGVLVGMILVNIACALLRGSWLGALRTWTVLGCFASAIALLALTVGGWIGPAWPLKPNVFVLGMANGAFAVAAIGYMMSFDGAGRESREGVRMGLWGAAQAVAFGMGGFLGAAGSDVARLYLASPGLAYGVVFAAEALLFLFAARLAASIGLVPNPELAPSRSPSIIPGALGSRETTV
jgi:MFS transporter, BCD family, chlorophyll transporter